MMEVKFADTDAIVQATVDQLVNIFRFDVVRAHQAVAAIDDKSDVQMAYNWLLDHGCEDRGGQVVPEQLCPHVIAHVKVTAEEIVYEQRCSHSLATDAQGSCPSGENWLCLECNTTQCSRYVRGHALQHWNDTREQASTAGADRAGHCLAVSLSDLSTWCYVCNAYVKHAKLIPLLRKLESVKFGSEHDEVEAWSGSSMGLVCFRGEDEGHTPPAGVVDRAKHRPTSNDTAVSCAACSQALPLPQLMAACALERPRRVRTIYEHIAARGDVFSECVAVQVREATDVELGRVHTRDYLGLLSGVEHAMDTEALDKIAAHDALCARGDVYVTPQTVRVARLAAGSVTELALRATRQTDGISKGFAIIRPPGHHAAADRASGTCVINNVAVAAAAVLADVSLGVDRVLIVDFDVHHGDGTQSIFFEDNRVLVASLHRHEFAPGIFFDDAGLTEHVGAGAGAGFNVNVPLPPAMDDHDYALAFESVILPIAHAFAPQFVLVSAGFDGAAGDPVGSAAGDSGGFRLTERIFAWMTQQLSSSLPSTQGRIVLALEGGYNEATIGAHASACIEALIGRSTDESTGKPDASRASAAARACIEHVRSVHAAYWTL